MMTDDNNILADKINNINIGKKKVTKYESK